METDKFAPRGLTSMLLLRGVVAALRFNNIPPAEDRCYHLFLEEDDFAKLALDAEFRRLVSRPWSKSVPDYVQTLGHARAVAFVLSCAIHTNRGVPAGAFAFQAKGAHDAIAELAAGWKKAVFAGR